MKLLRIIALAAAGVASGAWAADAVKDNAEALEKLRTRIQAVQQSLEADRGRRDSLRQQIEDSERHFTDLSTELRRLRRQLSQQAARRQETERQKQAAAAELQRHQEALGQQVRAAYVIGQGGQTKLVLNQDRAQKLSRLSTYYEFLARARARRIGAIADQVKALAEIAESLRRQTAELEATRSEHQGTLTALEAAKAERQEMLQTLASRIAGEEDELGQLQSDERELSRLIERLRAALADIPPDLGSKPFTALKGKLPWPLRGKLLASFGQPKAGGRLRWNGLWIAGSEGDAVRAVARGRVAYVGWMHRYGLIVVLEHEGGYYSLYGHTQNVPLAVGQWVQPGDTVATVGATGGHEQPGLYFELRKGTDAINPKSWLRRK